MKGIKGITILIFFLAFLLRIFFLFGPYHGDVNSYVAWVSFARDIGLRGFYDVINFDFFGHSYPNYPPLAILTFMAVRFFYEGLLSFFWWANVHFRLFPSHLVIWWEVVELQMLMKLPGILADLGIGWLGLRFFRTRNKKDALKWTAIFLFNPAVFYLSAIWGQIESLLMFFVLLAIFLLLRKKPLWGVIAYLFSLMIKPFSLIFSPIIFGLFWRLKPSRKTWIATIFLGLLLILVLSWPFFIGEPFSWFAKYYIKILPGPKKMDFLTVNAFNFWGLLYGLGRKPDAAYFFGLSFRLWSLFLSFLLILPVLLRFWRERKVPVVFEALVLISLATFLLMTRMHERYLFAVIPFLAILSAWSKKWRWVYGLFSFTFLLNLYHDWWVPKVEFIQILLLSPISVKIISSVNLFVFVLLWMDFLKVKQWRNLKKSLS